jgi:hypothetical protein
MQDTAKIKRNVAKMVSMNAPEEDIDAYITSEGLTIDAIKNFKESKPQSQQTRREKMKPTGVSAFLKPYEDRFRYNPVSGMGGEVVANAIGSVRQMSDAFQTPVTNPLNKDIGGRTLESLGRGGEFLLGALGVPMSLLSPIAPILETVDKPLDWALKNFKIGGGSPYKVLDEYAKAKNIPEISQTAVDVAKLPAYYAIGRGMHTAPEVVKQGASIKGIKHATKAGAFAGEDLGGMRRAGEFGAEFKMPKESKTTVIKGKGGKPEISSIQSVKSQRVISELANELETKILKPATEAGVMIDVNPVLDIYKKMHNEYLNDLTPKRSAIRLLERMIVDTEVALGKTQTPGRLTPIEAQRLKMRNNKILNDFYKEVERRGGSLSPLEKVEKQVLSKGTEFLREQIEKLHPDIPKINWTEGAAIEMRNAANDYVKARLRKDPALARGSGVTSAAHGSPAGIGLYAISELTTFRPFRLAYHRWMARQMHRLSGQPSEFIRPGEVGKYQPPSGEPK